MNAASEQSPRLVGRYALFEQIACGGMASVHVGRLVGPVGFSRTVAIKRLHPPFARDPEFVTMFLDEARLAARIRHPNVVPTLDVVAEHGEIFLVMEYIQGESFAGLLRQTKSAGGRVPREMVIAIVASVLRGLHAAHEAESEHGEPLGIVHRDVSPQNILVGVDGIARVLDFGIAKAAGRAQVTRDGQIRGKMAYIAPEQLRSSPADRKVDIYAAAVVLWEALTGERLFVGDSESATAAKVLTGVVPKPSSIVPDIPAELDAVVLRGLDRDRDARFATARDMATALESCGPMATATQLGEWVQATAGAALAERSRLVSEVERVEALHSAEASAPRWPVLLSSDEPTVVEVVDTDAGRVSGVGIATAPQPSSRRRLALPVVLGALGGAVGVWLWLSVPRAAGPAAAGTTTSSAADRSATPARAGERPRSSATTSGLLRASASASGDLPTDAPAPAQSAATHPKVKFGPAPRTPPTARNNSDCEPPYTIDPMGHRHYKMECL